jgi:hypothetical protein
MGDRVAIIAGCGLNQDGIAELGSAAGSQVVGRDHFPFPIQDIGTETSGLYNDVGDGRFYPAVVALAEACQWCYLIKKWRFDLTFDYSVGYAVAFDYQHKWTPHGENDVPEDNILPTRESDLVLPRWGSGEPGNTLLELGFDNSLSIGTDVNDFDLTNISHSVSNDDHSGELLIQLAFGHDVFGSRFASWKDGLVPKVYIILNTTENAATTGYLETEFFSTTTFPNSVGAMTAGTISAPIKTTPTSVVVPHYRELSNVQVSITPVEYWPYATKPSDDHPDGEDVYDTATGAQLRDPLS